MMLLVVNAGSSSIKTAVFDAGLTQITTAGVADIGQTTPDHATALRLILAQLAEQGIAIAALTGAAHRVVHGGASLIAPCQITAAVTAEIAACIPLAPLHNPANLTAIQALQNLAPDVPQCASFDTAFHATNPPEATTYALPAAIRATGLRRYGFHGLSYAALVAGLPDLTGQPVPHRLLALHLGNGASLCAIQGGQSVATTMGYSPLDGLTMGTRAGAMDGNAVLQLAQVHGISATAQILNRESGLLALGGSNDMRTLHAATTPEAAFAIRHFAYWAVRHAGSMIAAMGGVDAIAFTGGIGENDPAIRAAIIRGLGFTGARLDATANAANATRLHETPADVAIWTVPAREERQIASEALATLARLKGHA